MCIEKLLSPVTTTDFFDQHWESQPLHISRDDAEHFADLLSVHGIKEFVQTESIVFPDVQVVDASKTLAVDSYTISSDSRNVIPEQLLQHYAQGATIILAQVHRQFTAVGDLCRQINSDLRMQCQANAYLSPPGNQGFHAHFDTHDVFILQIAGAKSFRFYPSDIELPFTDDTYRPELNSGGDMEEQVTLDAGDCLYIPRGIVHDAVAHTDQPSLHITLGVFPFVVRDLIQEMAQVVAEKDPRYRSFINLKDPGNFPHQHQNLINDLFSREVVDEAFSRLSDEVAIDCLPIEFNLPRQADCSLNSQMLVNEPAVHNFDRAAGKCKLRAAAQVLHFDEPMGSAVEALLAQGSMLVSQFPGLNDEQKLALCWQLASVGIISLTYS